MSTQEKPALASQKAIDLSHHLSEVSRAHRVSPLKGLQKYFQRPGMISLAGGLPDPAYFPFASISGDALAPDTFPRANPTGSTLLRWFWSMFGTSASPEKSERITIPKHGTQTGEVELATALQYSPATGLLPLQEFCREFTNKVFKPAYSDWTTLVQTGNTDGIYRALMTLCNPGEQYLVEEWTFPSILAASRPMNILPASVKVDAQGISAVDLEHVLSTWDETARGAKRPHVIYTIPVGQNPTGATMGIQRKKVIYDLCVKYDIVIIEDDPYYFLQEGTYLPGELRAKSRTSRLGTGDDEETRFLNSLSPSFVRFDYQGRVIRLDSFSKTIAPGSRLGWFTCNPLFAERLERQGETSTQAPCGFSQALITQLVSKHWGISNFIRWLQGLQMQYTLRRDFIVDCIFEEFEVRPASDPALHTVFGTELPVWTAYVKTAGPGLTEKRAKMPLFSFVPPTAGMFVWFKFHLEDHVPPDHAGTDPEGKTFDERVWTDIAEHGLLISPGSFFVSEPGAEPGSSSSTPPGHEMAFRISFSMGPHENMRKGIQILAGVLKTWVST